MKTPKEKKCTECGQIKLAKEFYERKNTKDGLRHNCIRYVKQYAIDHKKQSGEWKVQNRIKIRKYQKEYDEKYWLFNKNKIKERRKKYYQKNKEKTEKYIMLLKNRTEDKIPYPKKQKCNQCGKVKCASQYVKQRIVKNGLKGHCKDCDRIYRIKNREKIKIMQEKSRQKCKNTYNEYRRQKRRTDVKYKILCNLRVRLHHALKQQSVKKQNHTIDLLGCSISFLKKYLESRFINGMSWDNYGYKGWHIDHIRPCVMFDLTKNNEQKKCFCYKNLMPMWWIDNIHKNSFYNGKFHRTKTIKDGINELV